MIPCSAVTIHVEGLMIPCSAMTIHRSTLCHPHNPVTINRRKSLFKDLFLFQICKVKNKNETLPEQLPQLLQINRKGS